MSHHVRGYRGLKLRRARRSRPGYEFGGRETQQRVANYISANPPPLPPIEVSFILFEFYQPKQNIFQGFF